jgi:hypothetical protein
MTLRAARLALATLLAAGLALGAATARATAVGAMFGVNSGGISGDAPQDAEYTDRAGGIAGVQCEFGIARDILLSLQPMYVRRGTGITVADATSSSQERDLELALDYVAVPVVAKFAGLGGRTYFAGGVDVAFLSGATLFDDTAETDVKDRFNGVDVGALLGFGVVVPVGRPKLTVEARYVLGLMDLGDNAGAATPNLPDRFHSTGMQLTAGILLPLGRP